MRDPYEFDFLTIRENYDEKELKDELTKHIESFLLELGNGFAYVGKEVRLFLGYTEMYCDLLFYNIKAHCYVVIESDILPPLKEVGASCAMTLASQA